MTETELNAELKAGTLSGLYFFYGEEDYLKNHRAAAMRKAVIGEDDSLADFNAIELSFGDGELDLGALTDAMAAPPMMAQQKIVTVSFADLESLKEKGKNALLEALKEQAEAGYDDTVLLIKVTAGGFDEGTPKKPSSFLAAASKFMKCVAFPYQPDSRLVRWMERHALEDGLRLLPDASAEILRIAGRSMFTLGGEIEKATAYAAFRGHTAVTVEDVRAVISRTDEDDAFQLANCILNGDRAGALTCLGVRIRKREEPTYLLAQVTRVFGDLAAAAAFMEDHRDKADFARAMKMHEYKAGLYYKAAQTKSPTWFAAAMEACLTADRAVKNGAGYDAVERLICGEYDVCRN